MNKKEKIISLNQSSQVFNDISLRKLKISFEKKDLIFGNYNKEIIIENKNIPYIQENYKNQINLEYYNYSIPYSYNIKEYEYPSSNILRREDHYEMFFPLRQFNKNIIEENIQKENLYKEYIPFMIDFKTYVHITRKIFNNDILKFFIFLKDYKLRNYLLYSQILNLILILEYYDLEKNIQIPLNKTELLRKNYIHIEKYTNLKTIFSNFRSFDNSYKYLLYPSLNLSRGESLRILKNKSIIENKYLLLKLSIRFYPFVYINRFYNFNDIYFKIYFIEKKDQENFINYISDLNKIEFYIVF